MRILYCTHEQFLPLSGGGTVSTVKTVKKLVEKGHDVTVLCPLYVTDKKKIEADYGIKLLTFSPFYIHRSVRLLGLKYVLYSVLYTFPLIRAVLSKRYDIIVVRNVILGMPAIIAKKLGRIPACLYMTDFLTSFIYEGKKGILGSMLSKFEKKLVPMHFDRIFVITPAMMEVLCSNGVDRKKVSVVYDGVDTGLFNPDAVTEQDARALKKELGLKNIVIFHGSLEPYHGIEAFLEIIKLVNSKRKDVSFLVIGAGSCYDRLKRNVSGNVKLLNFVAHEQIPKYLAISDVGIIPYVRSENLDMVLTLKLLEYLSMGLPVVTFDLRAIKEIFGCYGFVSISKSTEEFADNIIRSLSKKKSQTAVKLIKENFSWDKVTGAVCNEIENLKK